MQQMQNFIVQETIGKCVKCQKVINLILKSNIKVIHQEGESENTENKIQRIHYSLSSILIIGLICSI